MPGVTLILNVMTVGELAYNSTITGITEFLPVSVSFIAAKGCVSVRCLSL